MLTAGLIAIGLILPDPSEQLLPLTKMRLVETIVPLAMAAQVAFLLSPDDEPALEVSDGLSTSALVAAALERLALVFVGQAVIALVGSGVGHTADRGG